MTKIIDFSEIKENRMNGTFEKECLGIKVVAKFQIGTSQIKIQQEVSDSVKKKKENIILDIEEDYWETLFEHFYGTFTEELGEDFDCEIDGSEFKWK